MTRRTGYRRGTTRSFSGVSVNGRTRDTPPHPPRSAPGVAVVLGPPLGRGNLQGRRRRRQLVHLVGNGFSGQAHHQSQGRSRRRTGESSMDRVSEVHAVIVDVPAGFDGQTACQGFASIDLPDKDVERAPFHRRWLTRPRHPDFFHPVELAAPAGWLARSGTASQTRARRPQPPRARWPATRARILRRPGPASSMAVTRMPSSSLAPTSPGPSCWPRSPAQGKARPTRRRSATGSRAPCSERPIVSYGSLHHRWISSFSHAASDTVLLAYLPLRSPQPGR